MAKSWQPNTADGDSARGRDLYPDKSSPRSDAQGEGSPRLVDVPMAKDAYESLKHVTHTQGTTYGVRGDPRNFGVNQADCIGHADQLERDGYDCAGLNIATGRTKSTRYSGAK